LTRVYPKSRAGVGRKGKLGIEGKEKRKKRDKRKKRRIDLGDLPLTCPTQEVGLTEINPTTPKKTSI
jgi:hypothetical protein